MAEEEEYQPKNLLLTGGAGFIGSHVLRHLVKTYPSVKIINFDILDYCSNVKNYAEIAHAPNFTFIKGSILNVELVSHILVTYNIDTILHFAAQTHVDRSFGNSLEFTQTNVLGTHVLLECSKQFGIKRFIHVSTDEVYGEVKIGSANEMAILSPTNPYACGKAGAEFICQSYIRSFNLPIIITRGNNVFGPCQFPEKVIPKFIFRLNSGQKACIHGEGNGLRNFLHTSDVVKAFDVILRKGKLHEVYNIGTTFEISVVQLAKKLCEILGKPGSADDWIEHFADRAFNDSRYMIDSTKLRSLGWEPNLDFDSQLRETVDWYLQNQDYWSEEFKNYLDPHPLAYQPRSFSS